MSDSRTSGGSAGDEERGRLDGRLGARASSRTPASTRSPPSSVELEHRVRRPSELAEPAPDAAVAAGRAALAEVGEPQLRHVGQQHDVRRDHHRGLAGAVRALERGHVAIEQVALVEHALPVDERERDDPRAAHPRLGDPARRRRRRRRRRRPARSPSASALAARPLGRRASTSPCATSFASASAGSDRPRTGSANRRSDGRSRSWSSVDVDEAERGEVAHRLGDAGAHRLLRDALVVALAACGLNARISASLPSTTTSWAISSSMRHAPAALDRRRIEVEERERLADEHVARPRAAGATACRRSAAGRSSRRSCGSARSRTAGRTARGAPARRVEQRVPGDVVAIDVAAAAQREVELREVGVEDDVLELGDTPRASRRILPRGVRELPVLDLQLVPRRRPTAARSPPTRRASCATVCATRPASTNRSGPGSSAVTSAVTADSAAAPPSSARWTLRVEHDLRILAGVGHRLALPRRARPHHRRRDRAHRRHRAQDPHRRRAGVREREPLAVARELLAQPLGQGARRIEPHDVAQVAVHVLEVLRPRALARRAPRRDPVDLIDQPVRRGLRLGVAGRDRELLDVLQQREQQAASRAAAPR